MTMITREIMMIINHVISDHVIGGQNVIRFRLYLFGKGEKCKQILSRSTPGDRANSKFIS